jgi:hypothetical protein
LLALGLVEEEEANTMGRVAASPSVSEIIAPVSEIIAPVSEIITLISLILLCHIR